MSDHPIQNRTAKVLVVERLDARRQIIVSSLRSHGFKSIVNLRNIEDAISIIESDPTPPDWIVTRVFMGENANVFSLLALTVKHRILNKTRISVILEPEYEHFVPYLFQLGAFGWHSFSEEPKPLIDQISRFLDSCERQGWSDPIIAASQLRPYLRRKNLNSQWGMLEMTLLQLFPERTELVVSLAEALHKQGRTQSARLALARATELDSDTRMKAQKLLEEIETEDSLVPEAGESFASAHDLKSVVVVDPDIHSRNQVEEVARVLGVENFHGIADGREAWDYIKSLKEPPGLLVIEWRLPGLNGSQLIQRIRQTGSPVFQIFIHSSLVKSSHDRILLREMGVNHILVKPQSKKELLQSICTIVADGKSPSEWKSAVTQIKLLLRAGKFSEAQEMNENVLAKFDVPESQSLFLEAEMAYYHKNYEVASNLGIQAMHIGGNDVEVLNLMGKIYMKLGHFEQAGKFFERANKFSPNNVDRLCALSTAEAESGKVDSAQETLESAKSVDDSAQVVLESTANIALMAGDTKTANQALQSLDDISNVVAFMNNRAVNCVKLDKFDEANKLYKDAIKALPKEMNETKSLILYNLGLSFVRINRLQLATSALKKALKFANASIELKSKSLLKRALEAIKLGTSVSLNTVKPDDPTTLVDQGEVKLEVSRALPAATGIKRGDMRLHLVFEVAEPPSEEIFQMVDAPVRYRDPNEKKQSKSA